MPTVFYLAYGSNLHPLRLTARVPSALPVGVVTIPGYQLAFHKRGIDGSGKCLIYSEQAPAYKVYGALYEFDVREKPALDSAEGSGYREQLVQVTVNQETFTPYKYVAQPSHIEPDLVPYDWYKALVLAGAHYHGFPPDYIDSIEAAPSIPDPDSQRAQANKKLLTQMGYS